MVTGIWVERTQHLLRQERERERESEREREREAFLQEKAFDQGLEKSVGVFQQWENENTDLGTSLMIQCLRLDLPIQGVEV